MLTNAVSGLCHEMLTKLRFGSAQKSLGISALKKYLVFFQTASVWLLICHFCSFQNVVWLHWF